MDHNTLTQKKTGNAQPFWERTHSAYPRSVRENTKDRRHLSLFDIGRRLHESKRTPFWRGLQRTSHKTALLWPVLRAVITATTALTSRAREVITSDPYSYTPEKTWQLLAVLCGCFENF